MRFILDEAGKPIFMQIAETVKDAVLTGELSEESQIPSSTEISLTYKINPATVNKGVNLLVDEGIIYKRRGIGMFVAKGAKALLKKAARAGFYEGYIRPLMQEAEKLGIGKTELIDMISEE